MMAGHSAAAAFSRPADVSGLSAATAHLNAGRVHQARGELPQALASFESALRIRRERLGEGNLKVANVRHCIGAIQVEMSPLPDRLGGDEAMSATATGASEASDSMDEAIEHLAAALCVRRRKLGPGHIDAADSAHYLGIALTRAGRTEEALEALHAALRVRSVVFGDGHVSVAETLERLGEAYLQAQEHARATQALGYALQVREAAHGEDAAEVADAHAALGQAYTQGGYHDAAIKHVVLGLAIEKNIHGPDSPRVAMGYIKLGLCYQSAGESQSAVASIMEAIRILSSGNHDERSQTRLCAAYMALATVRWDMQEYELALLALYILGRANTSALRIVGGDLAGDICLLDAATLGHSVGGALALANLDLSLGQVVGLVDGEEAVRPPQGLRYFGGQLVIDLPGLGHSGSTATNPVRGLDYRQQDLTSDPGGLLQGRGRGPEGEVEGGGNGHPLEARDAVLASLSLLLWRLLGLALVDEEAAARPHSHGHFSNTAAADPIQWLSRWQQDLISDPGGLFQQMHPLVFQVQGLDYRQQDLTSDPGGLLQGRGRGPEGEVEGGGKGHPPEARDSVLASLSLFLWRLLGLALVDDVAAARPHSHGHFSNTAASDPIRWLIRWQQDCISGPGVLFQQMHPLVFQVPGATLRLLGLHVPRTLSSGVQARPTDNKAGMMCDSTFPIYATEGNKIKLLPEMDQFKESGTGRNAKDFHPSRFVFGAANHRPPRSRGPTDAANDPAVDLWGSVLGFLGPCPAGLPDILTRILQLNTMLVGIMAHTIAEALALSFLLGYQCFCGMLKVLDDAKPGSVQYLCSPLNCNRFASSRIKFARNFQRMSDLLLAGR